MGPTQWARHNALVVASVASQIVFVGVVVAAVFLAAFPILRARQRAARRRSESGD